jgi:hypothetical protein
VNGGDPRRILRATPARLSRRVNAATRRRLTARPRPGKWSAGEILSHLSEVELLWGYRLRAIVERSGQKVLGMDQDAWAKNSRYRRIDPRRALETFLAIRRANLEFLDGVTPSARRHFGSHSQFGRLTVDRIAALMAGHDINHARQIEAILGPRRGARPAERARRG